MLDVEYGKALTAATFCSVVRYAHAQQYPLVADVGHGASISVRKIPEREKHSWNVIFSLVPSEKQHLPTCFMSVP